MPIDSSAHLLTLLPNISCGPALCPPSQIGSCGNIICDTALHARIQYAFQLRPIDRVHLPVLGEWSQAYRWSFTLYSLQEILQVVVVVPAGISCFERGPSGVKVKKSLACGGSADRAELRAPPPLS